MISLPSGGTLSIKKPVVLNNWQCCFAKKCLL